jgi:hypothetical protein
MLPLMRGVWAKLNNILQAVIYFAIAAFQLPVQRDAIACWRCANIHIYVLSHLSHAGHTTFLVCSHETF